MLIRSILLSLVLPATLVLAGSNNTWDGKTYHQNKSVQFKGAIDQLSSLTLNHQDILDVGCGDGEITKILANKTTGQVLGIDLDPSMIAHAQEQYSGPKLQFLKMNALEVSFEQKFDLITSFNALHWISQQIEVLKKLHGALRPNGQIMIGIPTVDPTLNRGTSLMVRLFREMTQREDWKDYFKSFTVPWNFYNEAAYRNFLIESGFTSIHIQIRSTDFTLPNEIAFIHWMKQISPHLKYLPTPELQDKFLEAVAKEYLKIVPKKENGEVLLNHLQLEAMAQK